MESEWNFAQSKEKIFSIFLMRQEKNRKNSCFQIYWKRKKWKNILKKLKLEISLHSFIWNSIRIQTVRVFSIDSYWLLFFWNLYKKNTQKKNRNFFDKYFENKTFFNKKLWFQNSLLHMLCKFHQDRSINEKKNFKSGLIPLSSFESDAQRS